MVSSRVALSRDWRQHQRRAQTASPASTKTTSPGSGWSVSLAPRSAQGSSPRAKRTTMSPLTARVSKTATGSAWRMLTRLARSTSVLMLGSSPCLTRRRSSASAAERYCVGSTPKARKTERQAASVGSSQSGVSPRRARTAACSSRKAVASAAEAGSVADPDRVDDAPDHLREARRDGMRRSGTQA